MSNNPLDRWAGLYSILGLHSGSSKTGLALGSVYSFGVSGAAVAVKFFAPVTGNLTDVYFFVTAVVGTPGVTTVELRNYVSSQTKKPGATLHATQTITPGTTANKWILCHFSTPYSVTKNTMYWIVIGDAGWTTGNTATIGYQGAAYYFQVDVQPVTTVDGFATNGTGQNAIPPIVLKFADGTCLGNPFSLGSANDTNNTLERGLNISGLTEDLVISGIVGISTAANAVKIYLGTTAPGGIVEASFTLYTILNEGAGYVQRFTTPFTLRKNTIYRIVFGYSGNSNTPGYTQIEDSATGGADFTYCMPLGGRIIHTIDNGSGGWTDTADKLPRLALIVQDQSPIQHPASPFKGVFG